MLGGKTKKSVNKKNAEKSFFLNKFNFHPESILGLVIILCAIALMLSLITKMYVNFVTDHWAWCVESVKTSVKTIGNPIIEPATSNYEVSLKKTPGEAKLELVSDNGNEFYTEVYLTNYQSNPGFLLGNRFYAIRDGGVDQINKFFEIGPVDVEPSEIQDLNKEVIMSLAPQTVIWDAAKMVDGKNYFIILSAIGGDYKSIIMKTDKNKIGLFKRFYAVVYNLETKKMSSPILFAENDLSKDTGTVYPIFRMASENGKNLAIDLNECVFCAANNPKVLLIDIDSGRQVNLGRVSALELIGINSFKYKPFLEVECGNDSLRSCVKDPATLPWKVGSF